MEKGLEILDTIRSYQQQGVKFLIERDSALLADEMGLGKTVQTAVAINILFKSRKINNALIVCPSPLGTNWHNELNKWAPNIVSKIISGNEGERRAHYMLPYNIWIVSYDLVRRDIHFLRNRKYDLIVLDEAQRIKNNNSNANLACRLLKRRIAWALSGTPIENHPKEIVSLFLFIKPGLLKLIAGFKQIRKEIAPFYLRRKKSEVLSQMPKIIYQDLELEMCPRQRKVYDEVLSDSREFIYDNYESVKTYHVFEQINNLKKICNLELQSMESCKMDALKIIFQEMRERKDKVLIFSQYVKTLELIEELVDCDRTSIFHGGLDISKKDSIVQNFEETDGPQTLLISIKAGGVGLNLGSASLVILFDRWWNPSVEDQAIQRAHRFGRKEPLHVFRMLVKNSIEERINDILISKRKIFKAFVEEGEMANVGGLTKEELLEIILKN